MGIEEQLPSGILLTTVELAAGYVDAQNSYGAQIRTRYVCEGGKVTILQ